MRLDARTAVVTLAHDPKLDDPAILAALGSDVFYIGCLGSKRTHGKARGPAGCGRMQALSRSRGMHGPVGLNIGAKSPAEIAISDYGRIDPETATGMRVLAKLSGKSLLKISF